MADSVQIDLIVEAISKGFDKIEKDLKSVGDSSKKAGDEAKKGNEGFKAFGDSMKSLGTIAAGAAVIIGGALVAGLAKTVMAASDAEESMSKFNVVFKDLSGGPEALAVEIDKLSEATGRSKYELIGAVGALGDLFQPLGFSTDAAADLSLQMTSLAIDLSSFNNMPMDEALQRLQGTLIGSHENALAFGVVINENTLKAEMAANGWDKLTGSQLEQAKVQARLNLLMAGTTAAQGDAVRTADGFANQMKALEGSMKDLAIEIGQEFLPAAIEAIGAIREMADDAIPALVAAAKSAGPPLMALVKGGIEQISLAASTVQLNDLYKQLKDLGLSTSDLSDIIGDNRAQFDLWRTDADMADDLARNEAGVRKLNYAIIGMNLGLSDTPRIVGTVANGFQDSTSELEDFVTAMEAMNLGLPVAETGTEYWNLALRELAPAIEQATEATQQATVDTSLLAIDVVHATNAIDGMAAAEVAAGEKTEELRVLTEALQVAMGGDFKTALQDTTGATTNWTQELFNQATQLGLTNAEMVLLAQATGNYTDAQINAALEAAIMSQKVTELAGAVANGSMSVEEALADLNAFKAELDANTGATQRFIDKLNAIPSRIQVQIDVHGGEGVTAHGGYQNPDAGGGSGGAATSGAGGASSGAGGGHVGPGAASGIDFIVPPGFPNDSYLQPVQSGERVQVTPAGQSSTSGMTVNNNFNGPVNPGQVMREMAIVQAMMGA